jgi:hypothetical protein
MKKQRIMGEIVFAGGLDPDPVAAADALRKAGYEVTMMPGKFRSSLEHPKDYFIEASIDGTDDDKIINAIWNEINAIVDQYGGLCDPCGPIPPGHVPFADFFEPIIKSSLH